MIGPYKQPKLTIEDIKNINTFKATPFNQLYEEKDESEIYEIVKSNRKEQGYGPVKFNPEKYDTYSNLIVNKPRDVFGPQKEEVVVDKKKLSIGNIIKTISSISPIAKGIEKPALIISSALKLGGINSEKVIDLAVKEINPKNGEKIKSALLDLQKTATTKAASTFMGALDATSKPLKKGVDLLNKSSTIISEYSAAPVRSLIYGTGLEDEAIKAQNRIKDQDLKSKLFLGVLPGFGPNLNSIDENRRILLGQLSGNERVKAEKFVEDNKWYMLASDVATGIATGLGVSGAVKGLIPQIPKSMPLLSKSLQVFDDVVNPSLNNMAKLGAFFGLSAASYYGATGEWIFKDDKQAETGAITSFLPLGLKALGLGASIGKDTAKKLLENEDFNKGLESFLDGMAKKSGAKLSIIEDGMKEIPTQAIEEVTPKTKVENFLSSTATKKDTGIRDKISRAGMWKDDESFAKNVTNYYGGKLYSLYANNLPNQIGRLFGKNAKDVIKEIKGENVAGRLSNINRKMSNIATEVGDDMPLFSKYLFAKSRLQKTQNVASRGGELKTRAYGIDLSVDDLKGIVDEIEGTAKGKIFQQYSKQLSETNREVLNYMRDGGLLSQKQVDDLISSNPFYVKDKLLDEITEQFYRNPNIREGTGKIKSLKEGSEELDFNVDTIFDDMYDYYTTKIIAANKNGKLKTALELSDLYGNGSARILNKGDKINAAKGEVSQAVYIDGELKQIAVNKQWNDLVEELSTSKTANGTLNIIRKIAEAPAYATKWLATGPGAPIHSISMIIPETINGMLYAKTKGIPVNKYLSAWLSSISDVFGGKVNPDSFIANPNLKKSLEEIAKITGADFSYYRAIRQELQDGIVQPIKKKGIIGKRYDWISDLGHKVEMRTTRLPIIEAGLKQAGVTKKQFIEWTEQASREGISISEVLKRNGIDYKEIGGTARDVFNYADASNFMKQVGRFIPYANIAAVNAEVMRKLITNNPKTASAIITGAVLMSQAMYKFNYSGEKGDELRKQDKFLSHQSGFYFGEGDIFRVKNIPIIEWIYPLVVEFNEATNPQRDFDLSDAISKMIKDVTFAFDPSGSFAQNIGNITPVGFKQAIEVAANKDFFYDKELINQYQKNNYKGNELLQVNASTPDRFKKLAYAIAIATGGEEDRFGIVQGGYQISPINLQRLLSPVDILNYRTAKVIENTAVGGDAIIQSILNGDNVTDAEIKALKGILLKQYKLKDGTDEIYNFKEEDRDVVGTYSKSQLKNAIINGTKEEALNTINKFNEGGKYDSFIKEQVKLRNIKKEYGNEGMLIFQMSAKEVGNYYNSVKNNQSSKETLIRVLPLFSKNKQREILEVIKNPERN